MIRRIGGGGRRREEEERKGCRESEGLRNTTRECANNHKFRSKFHLQIPNNINRRNNKINFNQCIEYRNIRPSRKLFQSAKFPNHFAFPSPYLNLSNVIEIALTKFPHPPPGPSLHGSPCPHLTPSNISDVTIQIPSATTPLQIMR